MNFKPTYSAYVEAGKPLGKTGYPEWLKRNYEAEIADLKRQLEETKAALDEDEKWLDEIDSVLGHPSDKGGMGFIIAEIKKIRKDTERLDWLERLVRDRGFLVVHIGKTVATAREAIDAARNAD